MLSLVMLNSHFIKKAQSLNPITKVAFTLGLIFIIYNLVSRLIPIYFFWESGISGTVLISLGIISGLSFDLKKFINSNRGVTIFKKITIGLIILSLVAQSLHFMLLLDSKAYEKAVIYFKTNESVKIEIGDIKEITLLPMGKRYSLTNQNGTIGNVELHFIVKGKKRYKRAIIYLHKDFDTPWQVYKLDW